MENNVHSYGIFIKWNTAYRLNRGGWINMSWYRLHEDFLVKSIVQSSEYNFICTDNIGFIYSFICTVLSIF